jgi:hypothetical protein
MDDLAQICTEIEEDRATLEQVMERLGIGRSRVKPLGAWAAERLGRLKLNGRLRTYSPLSRLAELEFLYIGITGKMRMWKVLERAVGTRLAEEDFDFAQLAERADRQRSRVEELHLKAADWALSSASA